MDLSIATAFERGNGALKRLGGSPLPRGALIAAKTGAVVAAVVVQVVLLGATGRLLWLGAGWRPAGASAIGQPWLSLAPCHAAAGLLLAGPLRAEGTLALANALYLLMLLLGGVILPLDHLPGPVATLPGPCRQRRGRPGSRRRSPRVRRPAVLAAWAAGSSLLAVRPVSAGPEKGTTPGGGIHGAVRSGVGLVAGDGFEPPTFGL